MYTDEETWYDNDMTELSPEREHALMSDFFGSVSYVEDFAGTVPEVAAEDPSDDELDDSVTASGFEQDPQATAGDDLLGEEGRALLDFDWETLKEGPPGYSVEEIDKEDRGISPAVYLTHEATGRKFVAKRCAAGYADSPGAEQDASAILRAANVRGVSHAAMSNKERRILVTTFAGEREGAQENIELMRDKMPKQPHPTLARLREEGLNDMQQVLDIVVFDALVENQDRSTENLFIGTTSDGEVIFFPFDHGAAFGVQRLGNRRPFERGLASPGGLRNALEEYAEEVGEEAFLQQFTETVKRFQQAAQSVEFVVPDRKSYVLKRCEQALKNPDDVADPIVDPPA